MWQAATQLLDGVVKPVRWFGFSDSGNRWEAVNAHSAGTYHWVCAALQLVDRRGPASEGELVHLTDSLQHMCDMLMAIPSLPARNEALARAGRARSLLCRGGHPDRCQCRGPYSSPPGTKLRGLAEAAGLELLGDGCFHARDEFGTSQFVLSNLSRCCSWLRKCAR